MNNHFVQQTLELAVQTYLTIGKEPDPVSSAAFGVACGLIMERLNCNLRTAAALLRAELASRGL